MTDPRPPRSSHAGLALLCVLMAMSGCASPTSPTRPAQQSPPGNQPQPLTLACPANQSVTATRSEGIAVTFATPTVSGGIAPVQTSCTPASGSVFPIGTNTVSCISRDAAQTTRSCTFTVTVAPPAAQLTRTRFLAFGDSMTAGEVTQPNGGFARDGTANMRLVILPSAAYPTRLLNQLRTRYPAQAARLQVINGGRPGELAVDGFERLPELLSQYQPEVVLLLEGANELRALGTRGVPTAAHAIDGMARRVRNYGAHLFVATLPPPRVGGVNAIPASLIDSLNGRIRGIVAGEDAVLVDLHGALSTDVTRYIGTDGLHPTEAGYQRIAETFFAAIRSALEQPAR